MGFAGMHPGGRARAGAVGLGRGTAGRGPGPRVTPRAVYEPRPADCGPPSQELAQIPDFFCFRGSAPVGSQGGGQGRVGWGAKRNLFVSASVFDAPVVTFFKESVSHRWSLFSNSLCRTGGRLFPVVWPRWSNWGHSALGVPHSSPSTQHSAPCSQAPSTQPCTLSSLEPRKRCHSLNGKR